jgi:hypothetical protein
MIQQPTTHDPPSTTHGLRPTHPHALPNVSLQPSSLLHHGAALAGPADDFDHHDSRVFTPAGHAGRSSRFPVGTTGTPGR